MKAGMVYRELLSPITSAKAIVSGAGAVTIRWDLVDSYPERILCYKVEWSFSTNFKEVEGVKLTSDVLKTEITIQNLKHGLKYAFRISAGSQRGFCLPCRIQPHLIVISIFPSPLDVQVKRKKSGLRTLFSSNTKFVKSFQKGLYFAAIICCDQKVLCTTDDCLPTISIDEDILNLSKEDFYWAMKVSLCWDNVQIYNENRECCSSSAQFRTKFIEAVHEMQQSLGMKYIGRLHPQLLTYSENGTSFLATTMRLKSTQICQNNNMKWLSLEKVKKKRFCPGADFLNEQVKNILHFFDSSRRRLRKGLHLSYMQLHASLDAVSAVVLQDQLSMLPSVFIRANPHVTKEEWEFLRILEENEKHQATRQQQLFSNSIIKASEELFKILKISTHLMPIHRLYRLQIIEIDADTTVMLILPNVNSVCSAPSSNAEAVCAESKRSCVSLLLPIFELVHFWVYKEEFLKRYTRLFLKVDHLYSIAQYEQRNCLSDDDTQLYNAVIERLKEFQKSEYYRLVTIWKDARWLHRIANEARDKETRCTVALEKLLDFNKNLTVNIETEGHTTEETLNENSSESCEKILLSNLKSYLPSINDPAIDEKRRSPIDLITTSVVRIYAAYQCGFAKGTSVRLQITSSTTSREAVTLVVTQLAKAAAAAKKTKCEEANLHDYCLVVVIGSRERRLRDNFPLLKLQNPWTKGKLFVRRRDRVLEAIQFGNEASV